MKKGKDKSLQVIYIAGDGHSGSTLLDIMLGNNKGCFSAGEICNVTRSSILEEYCSCHKLISECEVWSEVLQIWEAERSMSCKEYVKLQRKYGRTKTSLRTFVNRFWPSAAFKQYCVATLQLFQAIKEVTGDSVIIDSSKSPQRIALLSRIVDVQVVHLCRNFKGVLNSAKKSYRKDIEKGIEKDNPARRTSKTLIDWLIKNLLCELFCLGVPSKKLKYRDYIQNPERLADLHVALSGIGNRAPYNAEHMLAGNIVRLKKDLTINPQLGFQYRRLNAKQRRLASVVDSLFWFWS